MALLQQTFCKEPLLIKSVEVSYSVPQCTSSRTCRVCEKGAAAGPASLQVSGTQLCALFDPRNSCWVLTTISRPHLLFRRSRIIHEELRRSLEVGTMKLLLEGELGAFRRCTWCFLGPSSIFLPLLDFLNLLDDKR